MKKCSLKKQNKIKIGHEGTRLNGGSNGGFHKAILNNECFLLLLLLFRLMSEEQKGAGDGGECYLNRRREKKSIELTLSVKVTLL